MPPEDWQFRVPVQVRVADGPEPDVQQGCSLPPQSSHRPRPAPLDTQAVRLAVQTRVPPLPQQGSPEPPHDSPPDKQVPPVHVPPPKALGQLDSAAMQMGVPLTVESQQPPLAQVLFAQHGLPAVPHRVQVDAPAAVVHMVFSALQTLLPPAELATPAVPPVVTVVPPRPVPPVAVIPALAEVPPITIPPVTVPPLLLGLPPAPPGPPPTVLPPGGVLLPATSELLPPMGTIPPVGTLVLADFPPDADAFPPVGTVCPPLETIASFLPASPRSNPPELVVQAPELIAIKAAKASKPSREKRTRANRSVCIWGLRMVCFPPPQSIGS